MKKYLLLLGACIVLGSCSTGGDTAAAALMMLGGSSQAPVYLECRTVSENEIEFEFSRPVKITSFNFDPVLSIASVEDGSIVKVTLEENAAPGILLTADLLAEDEFRNTINVLIPLRSRNNRMPSLQINELCTEASKEKTEFIEFKMNSDGNLGAMRVVILGNSTASKQTIYEFSPVEVKKDNYVVIHLRTLEESCINEYNEDIKESGSKNSSPLAWDFYVPGSTKLMQKAATAVYVLDQDDHVLDAVMISEKPDTWWTKDYFAEAAEFLYNSGAWKSANGKVCGPVDALGSADTTNTRTICRDEAVKNTNTAADWYITATSSATPGKPNNPKRFSK
jgi:hypothetical protein